MTSSVRRAAELFAVAALVGAVAVLAAAAHEPDGSPAPHMDFVPPPAGSYPLHAIMRAPDGAVLDLDGRRQPLRRFTSGKITLLSFMYTSCSDPHGCPLAYQVLHTVRHRLAGQPELRDRVRLVSLSFDPARDTPRAMKRYTAGVAPDAVEWAFLTTESPRTLVPLLDGFGQDVRVEIDSGGRPRGPLAHVLKVFLVDARGTVREIYTTSYLYPDVILNDIQTLHLEAIARRSMR
jgi:protein SCO1